MTMKTVRDLPDDVGVLIEEHAGGEDVEVSYFSLSGQENYAPSGMVSITEPEEKYSGPCGGAYSVFFAGKPNSPGLGRVTKGWGPLLYDVAIEYATIRGGGLAPDRSQVSEDARSIWGFYDKRSDVEKVQLDNPENLLTQRKDDNCEQVSAEKHVWEEDWFKSPLSRMYRKKPDTIGALKDMGKFRDGKRDRPKFDLAEAVLKNVIAEAGLKDNWWDSERYVPASNFEESLDRITGIAKYIAQLMVVNEVRQEELAEVDAFRSDIQAKLDEPKFKNTRKYRGILRKTDEKQAEIASKKQDDMLKLATAKKDLARVVGSLEPGQKKQAQEAFKEELERKKKEARETGQLSKDVRADMR